MPVRTAGRFRRGLCAATLGAALAGPAAAQTVDLPTARALWDRAVAAVAAGAAYKPGRMTGLMEELDAQGRTTGSERSAMRLSYPNGPDDPAVFIESYVKDGKDITAERRAQAAKPGGGSAGGPPAGADADDWSATPLDPERQPGITLLAARRETADVVAIDYEQRAGKQIFIGTVRLAAETAAPLDAAYAFKKPPIYLERFTARLVYAAPAAGGAVWVEAMEYAVTATLLVVKKRMRGELRFSDYLPVSAAPD